MLVTYHSERRKPYRISPLQFPGINSHTGYLTIVPGSQDIPLDQLRQLAEVPRYVDACNDLLYRGILEIESSGGLKLVSIESVLNLDSDVLSEPNLDKWKPYQAVELVRDTVDVELLKRWKIETTHIGVLEEIDAQILKITTPDAGKNPNMERQRKQSRLKAAIAEV